MLHSKFWFVLIWAHREAMSILKPLQKQSGHLGSCKLLVLSSFGGNKKSALQVHAQGTTLQRGAVIPKVASFVYQKHVHYAWANYSLRSLLERKTWGVMQMEKEIME